MLSSTKEANKVMLKVKEEWRRRRLEKLRCMICKYRKEPITPCHTCEEETSQNGDAHTAGGEQTGHYPGSHCETETCQERDAHTAWGEQTGHYPGSHCEEDAHTTKMETKYDCDKCGQEWRDKMEIDCEECGPGIFWEDQEICLIGLDVVALFPSMQSKTTGKIIRQYVRDSPLKIEGFDWREGARYIVINKKYTGDLECIWKVLPWRRKVKGTAPGIKAKELNSKNGNIEIQWQFPRTEPTPIQIREIQARCAEIGVRFLFENFSYKFAKESYQQSSGGPIGARVTMAAARIVMNDWGAKWRQLLETTNIVIGMLDGYVDDVRQESTSLRMGTRWDKENKGS